MAHCTCYSVLRRVSFFFVVPTFPNLKLTPLYKPHLVTFLVVWMMRWLFFLAFFLAFFYIQSPFTRVMKTFTLPLWLLFLRPFLSARRDCWCWLQAPYTTSWKAWISGAQSIPQLFVITLNTSADKKKHWSSEKINHWLTHWAGISSKIWDFACACGYVWKMCSAQREECANIRVYVGSKPPLSIRVKKTHFETEPATRAKHSLRDGALPAASVCPQPLCSRQKSDQSLWAEKQRDVFHRLRV